LIFPKNRSPHKIKRMTNAYSLLDNESFDSKLKNMWVQHSNQGSKWAKKSAGMPYPWREWSLYIYIYRGSEGIAPSGIQGFAPYQGIRGRSWRYFSILGLHLWNKFYTWIYSYGSIFVKSMPVWIFRLDKWRYVFSQPVEVPLWHTVPLRASTPKNYRFITEWVTHTALNKIRIHQYRQIKWK